MNRAGLFVMMSIFVWMLGVQFAPAQEDWGVIDNQSNGKPTKTKVNQGAISALEDARELFNEEGKERDVIRICLDLVEDFEAAQDYSHLVDCLFMIGDAYYYIGDWANGEKFMKRAADEGYRYFEDEMSSYPLKVIGECEFQLGKMDESLATFRERVQLLRRQNNTADLPGALFDVGGLLINLERETEAITILTEALKANNDRAGELSKAGSNATDEERAGNVVDHAEIVYHLAIANFRMDNMSEAKKYLEQAYTFFKSIHESKRYDVEDRLVSVLDDLVVVSENLGDQANADKFRKERDELNR